MYGDALKKVNASLGFNPEKPAEAGTNKCHASKFRQYGATFEAKSDDGSIKHSFNRIEGKPDENVSDFTANNFMDAGVDAKATYDKKKWERTFSRNMYKEDGNKVDMSVTSGYSYADQQWSGNAEASISTAQIADACTAGIKAKFEHKGLKDGAEASGSQTAKGDVSLTGDKWTFGAAAEYDVSGSKLKDAHQQMTYECSDDIFSWQRYNHMAKALSMGSAYQYDDDMSMTAEVFYDMKDGAKEINGMPVKMMFGNDIKFGRSTLNACGTFGATYQMHFNVQHKIDSNWSVGVHQHLYSDRIGVKDKNAVETGFELNYKL